MQKKLKILVVSNTFPIPPRNGVEIPIAGFMECLSEKNDIMFALVGEKENLAKEEERIRSSPGCFKGGVTFQIQRRRKIILALNELSLQQPAYFRCQLCTHQARTELPIEKVDILWISPVELAGLSEALRRHICPGAKLVLGTNDAIYYAHYERMLALLHGREPFSCRSVLRCIRIPFIMANEAKYLKRFDAVHVQTELEKKRLDMILGRSKVPIIIVAQNGIKEDLLKLAYNGFQSNRILLMANMDTNHRRYALWFIEQVWPLIIKQNRRARLRLAGKRATGRTAVMFNKIPGLEQVGFVQDLADAFDDVALSVVPVFKTSGVINRIIDCMSAGVPTIGFSSTYNHLNGFMDGVHGVVSRNATDMAVQINRFLRDDKGLRQISKQARKFVSHRFTWSASCEKVEKALGKIVEETPA